MGGLVSDHKTANSHITMFSMPRHVLNSQISHRIIYSINQLTNQSIKQSAYQPISQSYQNQINALMDDMMAKVVMQFNTG